MEENRNGKQAPAGAVQAGSESPEPRLNLQVVFTDAKRTRYALEAARELGRGLRAVITLVVAHVVPYPLSLDRPAVPSRFTEQNLLALIADQENEIRVQIHFCRNRLC